MPSAGAYLIFDDSVLDKSYSQRIELVRRQWSGNAKSVIKGIGVVTCVYVIPKTDQFWLIDYRLYDPDGDGKSKLAHVQDMLTNAVHRKQLLFQAVLMDSWYATKELMLLIESLGKVYYCPLKDNRQVDDSGGNRPYQRVDLLTWHPPEREHGKLIKIKGFPKDHKVRLFRVEVSSHRTDWVVTNGATQDFTEEIQQARDFLWKIAAALRRQASDRSETLPMPQDPDSTQPHRLCLPGLDPTQALGGPNRSHGLSTQTGLTG